MCFTFSTFTSYVLAALWIYSLNEIKFHKHWNASYFLNKSRTNTSTHLGHTRMTSLFLWMFCCVACWKYHFRDERWKSIKISIKWFKWHSVYTWRQYRIHCTLYALCRTLWILRLNHSWWIINLFLEFLECIFEQHRLYLTNMFYERLENAFPIPTVFRMRISIPVP